MWIMKHRLLWICLLAVAAVLSWNVYVSALNARARQRSTTFPKILSGADLAFRAEGREGDAVRANW